MRLEVCPVAVVEAPRHRVWALLADWSTFASWSGVELVRAEPPGPAAAEQRVTLRARGVGRSWPVRIEVIGVEAPARLAIDVMTPFRVVNHEVVTLTATGARQTLVRFN